MAQHKQAVPDTAHGIYCPASGMLLRVYRGTIGSAVGRAMSTIDEYPLPHNSSVVVHASTNSRSNTLFRQLNLNVWSGQRIPSGLPSIKIEKLSMRIDPVGIPGGVFAYLRA